MFEDWWKLYPRKVGKLDAAKAYAAAIKKGATHDELALGIRAFCQLLLERGTDRSFVPYPATWLRDGRWMDEEIRQSIDPALAFGGSVLRTCPPVGSYGASLHQRLGPVFFQAYFSGCTFTDEAVLAPSQARKDTLLNKFQHRIEGLKVEVKP